jgi:transposase
MLKKPALIERKSKKYFIKSTDKKKYELDHKQIEWQAKFDGFKAIATNMADVKPEIALEKYKDLYKIEQSFRTFKSYLETRPMFHWTDKRIEGHLVLCYIAFCLLNYLQQKSNYSEQTIRTALNKMDLSKIAREKEISWLRSAVLSLTPFRDNKLIINTSRS